MRKLLDEVSLSKQLDQVKPAQLLGLDLCPDFMEIVVGQVSFPFHISQKFKPILVGIRVENSKLR